MAGKKFHFKREDDRSFCGKIVDDHLFIGDREEFLYGDNACKKCIDVMSFADPSLKGTGQNQKITPLVPSTKESSQLCSNPTIFTNENEELQNLEVIHKVEHEKSEIEEDKKQNEQSSTNELLSLQKKKPNPWWIKDHEDLNNYAKLYFSKISKKNVCYYVIILRTDPKKLSIHKKFAELSHEMYFHILNSKRPYGDQCIELSGSVLKVENSTEIPVKIAKFAQQLQANETNISTIWIENCDLRKLGIEI